MISLDFRDSRSIYEQICDKIKKLILEGALSEGDKIMSVREMASSLTINPNTIVKAYKELENGGYIYSVQGKGYFVAGRQNAAKDADFGALFKAARAALSELCFLGTEKEEINRMVDDIWKELKR